MTLSPKVVERALAVKADDVEHATSRTIINGAVVIYNLDDPPAWLVPILAAQDEDGDIPSDDFAPVEMVEVRLRVSPDLVRDIHEDILALTLGNEAARRAKKLVEEGT